MAASTRFLFLFMEDFTHPAFANAIEPLRIANMVAGEALYDWSLASESGVDARAIPESW